MKIVHVSIYPPKGQKYASVGGVASYTKNLITSIPYQKEDNVYIICDVLDKKEKYIEDNINVIRDFKRGLFSIFQIYKKIKEIKPEIIHIQQELNLYGGIVSAYLLQWLLLFLKNKKTIVTLHGVVSLKGITKKFVTENNSKLPVFLVKIAFQIIYKPLCWYAKKIIVHEDYFKQILVNEYKIKANKIEIISHGVEDFSAISKEEACRNLKLDSNKDILLFMGYATGYKGIDLLIEGFAEYVKSNSNALLIIGAGKHPKLSNSEEYISEYNRLQNKAHAMISSNNFIWQGFVEEKDIVNYYSAADVAIYPYTTQMSSSGPMAISIGFEKPFLASDVFSNLVSKEFTFERNVDSFVSTIQGFYSNKEALAEKIRIMKKEKIWGSIGSNLLYLYDNI